jgi:hypothetical protein
MSAWSSISLPGWRSAKGASTEIFASDDFTARVIGDASMHVIAASQCY